MAHVLQVPRLDFDPSGAAVVTAWGQVGGMILRAGDRLIVDARSTDGLLLLQPVGLGRLMFGRWCGNVLVAEPGGVPASQRRWSPVGRVIAIERELSRGVLDGRSWDVAIRGPAEGCGSTAGHGRLEGGWMDPTAIDALCLRAAVAAERHGVPLAVAAAADQATARNAVDHVPPGFVRYVLPELVVPPHRGQLIVGPWRDGLEVANRRAATPMGAAAALSAASAVQGRVQLRLFGDSG